MSTIKTRNCVICGSSDIAVASGRVIRKDTYTTLGGLFQDIVIIASKCEKHKDEFRVDGYYGEYKEWMGMCDDPFKKEIKKEEKPDFKEITNKVLDYLMNNVDEVNRQIAKVIGISEDDFSDYLDYAKIEKVVDARNKN